jgi:hypothetical protein
MMDPAYGKYTVLQHGNMVTGYGHQSAFRVKTGDTVAPGQAIGSVGSTGASTGPHLHFQTGIKGRWVDPHMSLPQLATGGTIMNDGIYSLHKKETVLPEPLSDKWKNGGAGDTFHIKADFAGAHFATDVDVERVFENLQRKAELKKGPNRTVGR